MKILSILLFTALFSVVSFFIFLSSGQKSIKIALLYSKTGTMASQERVVADMVRFKVGEINDQGGLLERKIEIVEYDGKSDPKEFAKGAKELTDMGIKNIFGCWTSASRKAVKPIIEKNNAILFYPIQYEGVEESANIIYLGLTPNQQIKPTLNFIKKEYGESIYIVGSDYIYPQIAGTYVNEFSKLIGMSVVGEGYKPLGSKDFKEIAEDIKIKKPKAILNTINGDSNIAFFKELQNQSIKASDIPVFSMSVDESSLKNIVKNNGTNSMDGQYATWSYFNSVKSVENDKFKKRLKVEYGEDFVLTDAGYSGYFAVDFFKRAVEISQSVKTPNILEALKRDSMKIIDGIVYIDPISNHIYKNIKIAKVKNNEFDIVYKSDILIKPYPYTSLNHREFWNEKLEYFYNKWDGNWQEKTLSEDVK